jgi:hypothetical protein
MTSITTEQPSFKVPVCPTCARPMRLEGLASDRTYRDLSHMMYVCDCGRRSDQLIADPNSKTSEELGGVISCPRHTARSLRVREIGPPIVTRQLTCVRAANIKTISWCAQGDGKACDATWRETPRPLLRAANCS